MNYATLPQDMPYNLRDEMKEYLEDRVLPGSFLQSLLEDDLTESFSHVVPPSEWRSILEYVSDILRWVHKNVPSEAWGSPEKVQAWIERRENDA